MLPVLTVVFGNFGLTTTGRSYGPVLICRMTTPIPLHWLSTDTATISHCGSVIANLASLPMSWLRCSLSTSSSLFQHSTESTSAPISGIKKGTRLGCPSVQNGMSANHGARHNDRARERAASRAQRSVWTHTRSGAYALANTGQSPALYPSEGRRRCLT
jgi:hypothetical protein